MKGNKIYFTFFPNPKTENMNIFTDMKTKIVTLPTITTSVRTDRRRLTTVQTATL